MSSSFWSLSSVTQVTLSWSILSLFLRAPCYIHILLVHGIFISMSPPHSPSISLPIPLDSQHPLPSKELAQLCSVQPTVRRLSVLPGQARYSPGGLPVSRLLVFCIQGMVCGGRTGGRRHGSQSPLVQNPSFATHTA